MFGYMLQVLTRRISRIGEPNQEWRQTLTKLIAANECHHDLSYFSPNMLSSQRVFFTLSETLFGGNQDMMRHQMSRACWRT